MKLLIRKIKNTSAKKSVRTIAVLVFFLLVTSILYLRFNKAEGGASSPEKTIADLAGISRSDYRLNEQANLNIKVYAENTQDSANKADIILALDNSGSMTGAKIAEAKTALISFIDRVDTSKQTKLGLVTYTKTATLVTQLTLINSDSTKNALKAQVNAVTTGTSTCMGCAIQIANAELISTRSRTDGVKYFVLFTDGNEGPTWDIANFVNGSLFTSSMADNAATPIGAGSSLADSISKKIRYFTITYGSSDTTCSGNTEGADYSMGCSLLRFAASKTNRVALPGGFNWANDYKAQISGVSNGIDGVYHFKALNEDELNSIYLKILSAIEGGPAGLIVTEKLAPKASYIETNYVKDKGGRTYPYTVTSTPQGDSTVLMYSVGGVPENYYCDSSESECLASANPNHYIENNFLNINIKVNFSSFGKFDLDSNYSGCDSGNLQKVADNSKIDYYSSPNSDPTNNGSKYKTFTFSALCINVTSGGTSPKISKITYDESGNKKATFEAGDPVKVILEIDESESTRSDYIIEDFVPASANGSISYKFIRSDGFTKVGTATASDEKVRFVGTDELKFMHGINSIEYSYRI